MRDAGGIPSPAMRKYLAGIVVLLAAIATVTIVATPAIVSTRIAATKIAERVSVWTGGQVTLPREPVVSIFPTLSVTVKDVTVSGRNGAGGDPPLIVVPSLEASLKILPLLMGRLEVGTLTLDRPRIHLTGNGTVGDSLSVGRARREAALDEAFSDRAGVSLGELVLRDGTIIYENRRSGRTHEITSADLRLTWQRATRAAAMSAEFDWRGKRVEIDGELDDGWAAVAGSGSPGRLTLVVEPAQRSGSIDAGRDGSEASADDAKESDPSPGALVKRLALPIRSGETFGPLSVDGTVRIDATSVTLSDASVEFDGNTAQGEIVLSGLGRNRPTVQGSLIFEELDLGPYIETFMPRSLDAFLSLPVSAKWVGAADADLQLFATEINLGHMQVTGTYVRLRARDGRMTVGLGHAGIAGGRVAGQATIEPSEDGAAVELFGEADELSVDKFGHVVSLMGANRLIGADRPPEGTATGTFELSTRGATVRELFQSLTGQGIADVRNGSLNGADIVSTLERLTDGNTVIAEGEAPFVPVAGRTHYTRLTAYVVAGGGVARVERVRIAGERFEITLSGEGDLRRGEMEAEGVASLFAPGKGDGRESATPVVQLPFGVGGTLLEPVVAPGIPRIYHTSDDAALERQRGNGRFASGAFPGDLHGRH